LIDSAGDILNFWRLEIWLWTMFMVAYWAQTLMFDGFLTEVMLMIDDQNF